MNDRGDLCVVLASSFCEIFLTAENIFCDVTNVCILRQYSLLIVSILMFTTIFVVYYCFYY